MLVPSLCSCNDDSDESSFDLVGQMKKGQRVPGLRTAVFGTIYGHGRQSVKKPMSEEPSANFDISSERRTTRPETSLSLE